MVIEQDYRQFEKDHPAGITELGMVIVSCYGATRMSGTRGARVEGLGAAESELESRAPIWGIYGFANYMHNSTTWSYTDTRFCGLIAQQALMGYTDSRPPHK
ncbi:MAG: hypothetical protein J5U19_09105 [Candidatus Methanoperedens sp.]|nr:hypothetical protein [Candidatus Methanoperedens sp.]